MTARTGAPILEVLAGCEQLMDGYGRALRAVQQLTTAGLEGRGLTAAVLQAYHEQAEIAASDLERFRALVSHYKTMFTVH